jgi:cyclase
MTKNWCVAVCLLFSLVPTKAQGEDVFEIKPVMPGVYAAIARDQYEVNCNAAVILLDDGVLVVDSHSKPSAARALIEQIKTITDKPVRYVVDTHFHWDHYQGNQAYVGVWPAGIEIISSEATREDIERRGIPRIKSEMLYVPKDIARLKAELAKAGDEQKKAEIRENLRQAEDYLAELKNMRVVLPTLTFDRSLILHQKSRTVEVLWLGRGHTDGDVVVYLPKEKFLATGDLVQGFTPFMGDSYPYDWIRTLEKLDYEYAVGGHGGIMHGKAQLLMLESYFRDLMAETADAYSRGRSIDETRRIVAAKLVGKYGKNFPPAFSQEVMGNIDKAYRVVSGSMD